MISFTVEEAMTREVFTVGPRTPLWSVARLFASRHISGAPVVDDVGRAVGVISLHDLIDPDDERRGRTGRVGFYRDRDGSAQMDLPADLEGTVADRMSPFVLAVSPRTPLLDAVKLMVLDDVHRVLVTEQERLLGILTAMDVMRALVAWQSQVAPGAASGAPAPPTQG